MRAIIPVACCLASVTSVFAQATAPRVEFEVASIKRNLLGSRPWLVPPAGGRFTATNIPLKLLIGLGWPQRIAGGPSWVLTEGYDVAAKEPERTVSDAEFSLMMQNLLKDRFGLRVHTESHATRVYVLTPAKNGLKLPDAKPEPCLHGSKTPRADAQDGCGGMNVTPELIANEKVSMEWFTGVLEGLLGRPVVNRTGFTGSFKVHLEFAAVAPTRDSDSTKPSIFAALEKQLGLKLESQKGTEEVLVIDHVEKPSEN
jgi:uncharacterized protein (TIGR03435 family)